MNGFLKGTDEVPIRSVNKSVAYAPEHGCGLSLQVTKEPKTALRDYLKGIFKCTNNDKNTENPRNAPPPRLPPRQPRQPRHSLTTANGVVVTVLMQRGRQRWDTKPNGAGTLQCLTRVLSPNVLTIRVAF